MRVLIAPDKFRGTLTAVEAAAAIVRGWRRAAPADEVESVPIADGGDGTLDTLVVGLGGRKLRATVTGPVGEPVEAAYGLVDGEEGLVAIVEMARASGLALVPPGARDPLRATTRGTGELILAAARHRPKRIIVCIGGSATNDGGAGMAQALGVRLLDDQGRDLAPGGAELARLSTMDLHGLVPDVRGIDVVVATDVDNPLVGPQGAAAVYGPQKGAGTRDIEVLDTALGRFAEIAARDIGVDPHHIAGAGAAGGLGAGLVVFLGARLRPGFDLVAEALDLGKRLAAAEVAVTGEGRYDAQSEHGKAPGGVLRMARSAGCRTVLIAGQVAGPPPPADLVYALAARWGRSAALGRAAALVEEAAALAAVELKGSP